MTEWVQLTSERKFARLDNGNYVAVDAVVAVVGTTRSTYVQLEHGDNVPASNDQTPEEVIAGIVNAGREQP
jgi:hypothetical protein